MITLKKTVLAWGTSNFDQVFKAEVAALGADKLPLQQALTQCNRVSDNAFTVMVLNSSADSEMIRVKAGIFYTGVNAGSCCADDPTPLDEVSEYCEIQFEINRTTAEAAALLKHDL